jgi:protein-disulfide isomerase
MHDQLFNHQDALGQDNLVSYAKAAGLDGARFRSCQAGPAAATVRADMEVAVRAGAGGTPVFFIGVAREDGKVRVLRKISGASPFATFKTEIDRLLASPDALK